MLSGRAVPRLSLVLAVLGAGWRPALATADSSAAAPAPSCDGMRSSLTRLGCAVAHELLPGTAGAELAVTVLELKSERELPRPAELRERAREAVRSALGPPRAGGERSKLRVELRLEATQGVLRVNAELRRAIGLWQRALSRGSDVQRRAFVEVPLDAELRALVPPPPLVVSDVVKLRAPERGIVALACGALAADGGQELALVSRSTVRVGRIVKGEFSERARTSWAKLSVVAPTPLREPIASAEITPAGRLRIGITDRRDGVELDSALAVTARLEGRVPVPGGQCALRSGLGLLSIADCSNREPPSARAPGSVLDALASSSAGAGALGRELASGALELAGKPVRLNGAAGAQLALGDADGDGAVELAYASNTSDGTRDRLTLVTLEGAAIKPRFELAVPSITALAICAKPEGPGMAPIAVATGSEIWLIR